MAVLFLGGVQLIIIGVLGRYLAHVHDQVVGRPLYLVSRVVPGRRGHDAGARPRPARRPGRGSDGRARPDHRRRRLRRREPRASRSPSAIPTGRSSRSTTCTGAARSSTCRGCATAGVAFVHGDVREPADLAGARRARRARRVLGRAVGDGRASTATPPTSSHTQPHRRLQLPRARPPRRRPGRLPLDQPRLPGRARSTRSPYEEARDPLRARRRAGAARRLAPPGSPRTSRSTGARTLYGATKLAAELLIGEYADAFGAARRGRPLRRDRRALADGQGRPGRLHPLAARATTSGATLSYIGYGGAGKQVRDLLHVDDLVDLVERPARRPRALGGRHRQRRRRPRDEPLAAARRPSSAAS